MDRSATDNPGPARGVLLIGFSAAAAARLVAVLDQAGLTAHPVADAEQTLARLASTPIGVALADLEGPFNEVLGGIEAVRSSRPQRPLLGVGSARAGAAMADALRVLGFEGLVAPDAPPQELIFRVNAALDPLRRAVGEASRRVPTDLPARFDGLEGPAEGRVLNMSETGFFLATDALLPINRTVTVDVELDPRETPVRVTCRVVWANRSGQDRRQPRGMGLQFLELRPTVRAAIQTFLGRSSPGTGEA